jgi:hypothetical protein
MGGELNTEMAGKDVGAGFWFVLVERLDDRLEVDEQAKELKATGTERLT